MKKNLVGIKKVCIFAANKNNKELVAARINTGTNTMKINITINVKECNFNTPYVDKWHELAITDPHGLYLELVKVSQYYNSITSPDLAKTADGLNATHLKQNARNYDFYQKQKNNNTIWSVSLAPRRGYTAYIFTVE